MFRVSKETSGAGRVSEESRADRRWRARFPGALWGVHCRGFDFYPECSGAPLEGSEPSSCGICFIF